MKKSEGRVESAEKKSKTDGKEKFANFTHLINRTSSKNKRVENKSLTVRSHKVNKTRAIKSFY